MRSSLRSFLSGLTSRIPMKKICNMVHSLQGEGNYASVKHLLGGGNLINMKGDIANELASLFSKVSSSTNSTSEF